jgi:hypothetical protein
MLIALLVIAGLATITLLVMYLLLRHSMQKEIARLRAELSLVLAARKPVRGAGESQMLDEIHREMRDNGSQSLTPEALSEVAVSLSGFLGRDVRISAVADGPAANEAHHSWAQQGCVAIQNSHDLAIVKQAVPRPPVSVRRHVA